MAIKTITPRLPRLGMIRLGTKQLKSGKRKDGSTWEMEVPVNVDHFIFPKEGEDGYELLKHLTEKTNVLDITFPFDDIEMVLDDAFRLYGKGTGLKCKGDGLVGHYAHFEERKDAKGKAYTHKEMKERDCYERGCQFGRSGTDECGPSAYLSFCIQGIAGLGVWQLVTNSYHAIVNFRAVLQLAKTVFGRITNLPFQLYRYKAEVAPDGQKKEVVMVGLRLNPALANNLLGSGVAPVAFLDTPGQARHGVVTDEFDEDAPFVDGDDPNTAAPNAGAQPSPAPATTAKPGGESPQPAAEGGGTAAKEQSVQSAAQDAFKKAAAGIAKQKGLDMRLPANRTALVNASVAWAKQSGCDIEKLDDLSDEDMDRLTKLLGTHTGAVGLIEWLDEALSDPSQFE